MWNLNDDNELDHLSREAAEGFSLDQSPDSWSKIHARLDAEMPEERRRRYLLFLLFFMVIGSGVFWITRMNGRGDDHSVGQSATTAKEDLAANRNSKNTTAPTTEQSRPAQDKNISNNADASQSNSNKSASSNSIDNTVDNTTRSANDRNVTSNPSPSGKNISAPNKNTQRSTNQRISSASNGSVALGTTTLKNNKSKGKNKQDVVEQVVEEPAVASQATVPSNDKSTSTNNEPVGATKENVKTNKKANDEVAEATKKSEPKEKDVPSRDNIRWTFGAVYAPDISTVNFTHTQPAGLNIGVTIDYRLSQRFSLQTGFIYTKKNYKLNGEDYHPPKGTWFDYVNLKDVTGNCSMYDIPLNLRYNLVVKKSSNIFISAGLSSYLMKQENYSYFYYYNGVPTTRDRGYPTNDDYLFSILNLSAGFEKKLNRSFSLQVEPFFKQTLTGVGFGSISLNSTGIYFALRYNPLKATKTISAKKN